VKLTATEDHPALGFLLKRQKGVQGITDGGKRNAAVDGFDNPRRGGTAVKKQRLVRLYQGSRKPRGFAFLFHQARLLVADQIMAGATRLKHNVSAQQHDGRALAVQIPTNGHLRDAEEVGGFLKMQLIAALQRLQQLSNAVIATCFHSSSA
jgi:hypothetical protein